jgi:phosphate-selective porin OprO/OprP
MTPARTICHALVALIGLSFAAPVFAEEPPASEDEGPVSTDEMIQELPVEQQEAVKAAIEQTETPEGTTVIVVPPPEPTMRKYDPATETDQEAAAEERVRHGDRVPGEELHPKGEDELMGDHVVDRGDIKFRPGKGVEINSADDKFQLRIRVRVQMLYSYVHDENLGTNEGDEPEANLNDFRLRRARFIFQGTFFGKDNQYKLEIDPLRADNVVLDYYLDFTQNRDIEVRVGQYKISSNRQRVISSGNLQMVDRSSVNSEFSLDRDMSIDLRSRDFLGLNKMRYVLGLSTGNGLNNPQFTDFGMVYLVRFEYLPMGIFRDYSETDFARTTPRLSIGATYSFFDNADRDRGMVGRPFVDGGTADYHFVYVDAMFKARGFSAISELAFRTGTRKYGDITMDPDGELIDCQANPQQCAPRNGLGWMLQAGYLIPNTRFEFAGRGSLIKSNSKRSATSLNDSYAATFSVSWYFAQHPFKIQADVSQIWEDTFGDGSTVFRLQLQASL